MSINSIETATAYSGELDKLFAQKSVTGIFADNVLGAKFVGAKTVMIPEADFVGLTDYDRKNGFTTGTITVSNTPYTMTMDRARSLQIDREDLDETGVAKLAGSILGEYVRTKVAPECDAYVLSKIANIARENGNCIQKFDKDPYEAFIEMTREVSKASGYDSELVAFVESNVYSRLCNDKNVAALINTATFKNGEVDTTVKTLNGVALIPVTSDRMLSGYNFNNNEEGGFKPVDMAYQNYIIVCPKTSVHLVKKTEKMRVFTPEQNPTADAYKFDFRIYYDAFVKNSEVDTIWAWSSGDYTYDIYPKTLTREEANSLGEALFIVEENSNYDAVTTYEWYECNEDGSNPKKVAGQNRIALDVDKVQIVNDKHYFFAKVYVNGVLVNITEVVTFIK